MHTVHKDTRDSNCVLFYSDSVEREDTLGDNSVQLQSFVQYEPDLFVSRYVCMQHTVCIIQQSYILATLNTFLYLCFFHTATLI